MTKLLDQALEAARNLPPEAQDDIARIVLQLAGNDDALPVALSPEERAAIVASKDAASCGEFATDEQWAIGQIAARAVIDATASLREVLPLWLFHSRTQAVVFDRRTVALDLSAGMRAMTLNGMENTAFTRMEQNLRPIRTK